MCTELTTLGHAEVCHKLTLRGVHLPEDDLSSRVVSKGAAWSPSIKRSFILFRYSYAWAPNIGSNGDGHVKGKRKLHERRLTPTIVSDQWDVGAHRL